MPAALCRCIRTSNELDATNRAGELPEVRPSVVIIFQVHARTCVCREYVCMPVKINAATDYTRLFSIARDNRSVTRCITNERSIRDPFGCDCSTRDALNPLRPSALVIRDYYLRLHNISTFYASFTLSNYANERD